MSTISNGICEDYSSINVPQFIKTIINYRTLLFQSSTLFSSACICTIDQKKSEIKSMIESVQQAWQLVRGKLQTCGTLPTAIII